MQSRRLILVAGAEEWLDTQFSTQFTPNLSQSLAIFCHDTQAGLPHLNADIFPFSKAKNALGQEWQTILFDCRKALHLEALAIASGTVLAGGTLYLWINDWQSFQSERDLDSLRWADGIIQSCPYFRKIFQDTVKNAGFPLFTQPQAIPFYPVQTADIKPLPLRPTVEQEGLLNKIKTHPVQRFILTAKRGRGKSALAGFLAELLLKEDPQQLLLTAANKKAVQKLQQFCHLPIPFCAPDALLENLATIRQQRKWLFIDEAAMLPLPMLQTLCSAFEKVLCTTTIESYEGTGQGFSLKFMQSTAKNFHALSLDTPLRWQQNDPIEKFIEDLLLVAPNSLNEPQNSNSTYRFLRQVQLDKNTDLTDFYQLLKLAHYRTTPLDLRRLLDAPRQQFFAGYDEGNRLQSGIWGLEEGDMHDEALLVAIRRGERRPNGNLVAQLLLQNHLDLRAGQLRSVRISRIAVHPALQNQGLGQKLLTAFQQQLLEKGNIDYLSVSFGYDEKLAYFWHKAGFQLVYLSHQQTASSGCYSAVGVLPLTPAGEAFCKSLINNFQRNFALSHYPLANQLRRRQSEDLMLSKKHMALTDIDKTALADFAYAHRPFITSLPALTRLLKQYPQHLPLVKDFLHEKKSYLKPSARQWLKQCRQDVALILNDF